MKAIVAGIEWGLTGHASVQCDVCNDLYRTGMWKFPLPAERAKLAEALREDGWIVDGDHQRHICPNCKGDK